MSSERTSKRRREGPEAEGGEDSHLQELEQHITQRISQLVDPSAAGEPLSFPEDSGRLTAPEPPVVPHFDAFATLDLPGRPEHLMRSTYEDLTSSLKSSTDVVRHIEDLGDLITESVRQVNIRIVALEEKFLLLAEEIEKGQNSARKDIKSALAASGAGKQAGAGGPSSEVIAEIGRQIAELSLKLDKTSAELRQRLDERLFEPEPRAEAKIVLTDEIKDYLNRHFFNLAMLVVIIAFVGAALMASSLDKVTSFLTESIETMRLTIEKAEPASGAKDVSPR